jgi:hypothetical protein
MLKPNIFHKLQKIVDFSQLRNLSLVKNLSIVCYHFKKDPWPKNIYITLLATFYLFLLVISLKVLLLQHLFLLQFIWQLLHDHYPHVFSQLLYHMFYNMLLIFSFFNVWIKSMHMTIITKQTSHNLKISKINFFIIIYTIKGPTNCIPILTSQYFSLNTCNISTYFFPFH